MEKVWQKHYPDHIAKELEIPNKSLSDMLNDTIATYGDKMALYFYGKEITYKKLGSWLVLSLLLPKGKG